MASDQCPFCQLIANPDQLFLVGETENFYAWLEVNPRAKGHSMVVPKEHRESALEFSEAEWEEAMSLAREVGKKAEKGLDADGVSMTVNIGEAGGQMLPHAYIQVFPRFREDENAGTPTGAIFPQQEHLREQLDKVQESMSRASVEQETKEAHPEGQRFQEESVADRLLEGGIGARTGSQEDRETGDIEHEEDQEEDEQEDQNDGTGDREEETAGEEEGRQRSGSWDGKSYEWR